jgi:hypothetical protein
MNKWTWKDGMRIAQSVSVQGPLYSKGPPWNEAVLFALGSAWQKAADWHLRSPV